MYFSVILEQGLSFVVRSQHSGSLPRQQFLGMAVKRIDSRRELMMLGMLVQLGKEETVSTMDTVEKSYGCYAGHGAWFRIV
mgnify:CR=1 FL=1